MKIILCDPVDDAIKDHFLNDDRYDIIERFDRDKQFNQLDDAQFLVVRSGTTVDQEMLDAAPNLIGIVRAGVGLDNIDLDYAEESGVNVENTPEASTNAVAELVVGHILSIYRSIPEADQAMKNQSWIKGELDGREIQDKTVGIIGYGRIGARVGTILSAFGAHILGYDKFISNEQIESRGGKPSKIDEILQSADIITVHVPLTEETQHLISDDELKTMNDDAVLINCSRGGVYDEDALNRAINDDEIYGVGLDTYETEPPGDRPLIQNSEVVTTPHVGASTGEAQERIGQLVIDKIESMS